MKYTSVLTYKIIGAPKKFKNGPVSYLGLELIIHVIKSQIHLLRKSLKVELADFSRVYCSVPSSIPSEED
jgi:hypothetical protein